VLRRLLLPFLAVALLSGVACSVDAALSSPTTNAAAHDDDGGVPNPQEVVGSVQPNKQPDGGSVGVCVVTAMTCSPDDDGVRVSTAKSCPVMADASVTACRVSTTGPSCGPSDAHGTDGVSCQTGDDCAAGFDCVDGDKGGVCRRTCCSSSCEGYTSQNGGPTFCDVQVALRSDSNNRPNVPVCLPIKSCTLLSNDCGEHETCAIVSEKGATGCVGRGTANVNDACNVDHCADGLTCLGSVGDRRCYKLCRTEGTDCGPNDICTTSSAFQDTNYGVCKSAQ
jgi:hypothetical protein